MISGRSRRHALLCLALAGMLAWRHAPAQKGAAVPVKPGAPLAVEVELPQAPMPGAGVRVRIALTATADLDDVRLTLSGSDGLVIAPPTLVAGELARGATRVQTIELLALSAGRHRLDVFVTGDSGVYGPVARSVAIPIVVGPDIPGDATDTAKPVERLRRLPATETVR